MVGKRLKAGKWVKHAVGWIVSLALLFLALNYFLTGRLERYLKKELIERTRLATDGFYRLSFEDLSISFFNGELKVEGVSLQPDSAVFHRWAAVDSLPRTYVRTRIGLIDFKGINLTWRWNYRRLHFNTFEVISPDIQVFNVLSSGRVLREAKREESKTLYEVISPYIDVLSVRRLNLENARVSYRVQGEVSPIAYQLDNVSFHAYDFQLDSTSYRSGDLLYCRNFDFVTNQPQTLLVNNDFSLKTDRIRLSTEDSVIYIRDIQLEPREALWDKTNRKPSNYLLGRIKTVDVKGIHFDRREALNYLTARSFYVDSSSINAYDLSKAREGQLANAGQKVTDADSLVQALSLYDVISPVLHSVSVDEIHIERAGLMYSKGQGRDTEVYSIPEFNFQAKGLLIDSLVEPGQELRYFQSIRFEAKGLHGVLTPRNHRFDVKHVAMNTATGSFRVDSLRLRPLTTRSRNDYLFAGIDTIRIEGLTYDKGIHADMLLVRSPRLRYYKMPSLSSSNADRKTGLADNRVDVENLLNPFLRFLSIREIRVRNGYASLTDRSLPDTVVYRLNDFNFFADDILVDGRANRMNRLTFSYGNLGFSFRDFDNAIQGGDYRLRIEEGELSTADSLFCLRQVRLNAVRQGLTFTSPLVDLTGLRLSPDLLSKRAIAGNLHVVNPAFDWKKPDSTRISIVMEDLALRGLSYDSLPRLGDIQLQAHDIQIPLDNGFYLLKVGTLDMGKSVLRLDSVRLVSPYPKMEFAYKQPEHQDWFDVRVGRVSLTDIDWQRYWSDSLVHIGGLWINDVLLQNLKNRKIPVKPHIVPMIYAGLQKAPVRLRVDTAAVVDFSVIYEELPLKGEKPGRLYFSGMNGYFSGLTNIVSSPDQYITLRTDGNLMGSGYFKATWKLPVDSLNDRFLLEGRLDSLDLLTLNEIVRPLAPAEILDGFTRDVYFSMDASSKGGRIRLDFPYRNLKIAILKEKNGEAVQTAFLSRLANMVLRNDNPSHPEHAASKLRHVDITVERDPYHSTFNYLWQLFRPALVESVGISKKEQDSVKKVTGFFTKVKRFFGINRQ